MRRKSFTYSCNAVGGRRSEPIYFEPQRRGRMVQQGRYNRDKRMVRYIKQAAKSKYGIGTECGVLVQNDGLNNNEGAKNRNFKCGYVARFV